MGNIDIKHASLILDRAFKEAHPANDDLGMLIERILRGPQKTYRYMLITALLAKACDGSIDIFSLQKGDGAAGKYDARSLCHKVIVPFETIKLPGCLGGSNEPFLNKPARYQRISIDNATRDKESLGHLVEILSKIDDSNVYHYLCSAIATLKEISASYISRFSTGDILIDMSKFSQIVLDYIYQLTDHPSMGEVCPLIVAELEQMYLGKDYKVEAHKVTQSGSSSKEVGDIDIYNKKRELLYSIEVKDKDFTINDVLHAIHKFRDAAIETSFFIYGKQVTFDEKGVNAILQQTGREGHFCCLISILHYAKLRLADLKTLTLEDFLTGILAFARAINAAESTVDIIKSIASKIYEQGSTLN